MRVRTTIPDAVHTTLDGRLSYGEMAYGHFEKDNIEMRQRERFIDFCYVRPLPFRHTKFV
jgi:hypothetical protein